MTDSTRTLKFENMFTFHRAALRFHHDAQVLADQFLKQQRHQRKAK